MLRLGPALSQRIETELGFWEKRCKRSRLARPVCGTALDYAKHLKKNEQAIAEFQSVQWLLAGMAKDIEAERLYLDAKITQIDEGSNQIQRMIITCELIMHGIGA